MPFKISKEDIEFTTKWMLDISDPYDPHDRRALDTFMYLSMRALTGEKLTLASRQKRASKKAKST